MMRITCSCDRCHIRELTEIQNCGELRTSSLGTEICSEGLLCDNLIQGSLQLGIGHFVGMVEPHDPPAIQQHQGRSSKSAIDGKILFAYGNRNIGQAGIVLFPNGLDIGEFLLGRSFLTPRNVAVKLGRPQ
jgi:hypothetical protein